MEERYKIEGEVGKGGEGFVYKAYDKVMKRHVALKRVLTKDRGTLAEVEKAADALIAEAHTLSALNHPSIVTVYDVGKDEEGGFVVMELIKGETLEDTVKRGAFTEENFYRFARQTMEALMAAQEINVVHRDLKPGNVMLVWHPGGRFQAKILDFGLAKFSEVPSLQTLDFGDSVKGSIYFMAPEQFERTELDERTDLYAMGCVYYFALTGSYPYDGDTATMVMVSHLQHQVVSLEKVRPDLPPAICQWVMWLINRGIGDRPDNAEVALNHFPMNPTATQLQDLGNLAVNKTRSGLTTGVQVVLPPNSAAAPTGMVMTVEEEQAPAPVAEPFDEALYDEEHPSEPIGKKGGWLGKLVKAGLLAAGVVGLVYYGRPMLSKLAEGDEVKGKEAESSPVVEHSHFARLEELASAEHPEGSAEDVDIVLAVLSSKNASKLQKNQGQEVLAGLDGAGMDEVLLDRLKRTKESGERIMLSRVVAARKVEQAVPAMLAAIGEEKDDSQRLEILNELRVLVSVEDAQVMISSLKKDCSPQIRAGMEQIVASAFRRIPATRENLEPLIEGLGHVTGEARASLWRILGMRGGTVVRQYLDQVFLREKHDKVFLLDAMEALKVIQDPRVVNLLNTIYSTTQDKELKAAAADAIVHAVTIPSNDQMDERRFWWQLALKIATKSQDLQKVFTSIADYTDPKSFDFLMGVSNSRTYGLYAKSAIERIRQTEKEATVLEAGDLLAVEQQMVRTEGANFDPEGQTALKWMDPGAWFVWHFKVKETGVYKLEVPQALAGEGENQFNFIIGMATLKGNAIDTGDWDDYQPNKLGGAVRLATGPTYTLFLKAGEVVQPRMMNFRGVRLQKQ